MISELARITFIFVTSCLIASPFFLSWYLIDNRLAKKRMKDYFNSFNQRD